MKIKKTYYVFTTGVVVSKNFWRKLFDKGFVSNFDDNIEKVRQILRKHPNVACWMYLNIL